MLIVFLAHRANGYLFGGGGVVFKVIISSNHDKKKVRTITKEKSIQGICGSHYNSNGNKVQSWVNAHSSSFGSFFLTFSLVERMDRWYTKARGRSGYFYKGAVIPKKSHKGSLASQQGRERGNPRRPHSVNHRRQKRPFKRM